MDNLFSLICIFQSLLVWITHFQSISDVLTGPLLILSPNIQKLLISRITLLQISYSLVVILELSSVSGVQYKEIMIIGDE